MLHLTLLFTLLATVLALPSPEPDYGAPKPCAPPAIDRFFLRTGCYKCNAPPGSCPPCPIGYVDVKDGYAGMNRSTAWELDHKAPFLVDPSPRGYFFQEALVSCKKAKAYLQPVPEYPELYDFKFGAVPKKVKGILTDGFEKRGVGCGGNCGGAALVYNSTFGLPRDTWLIYPDPVKKSGWRLRWSNGTFPMPPGHSQAFLWREPTPVVTV